MLHSFSVLVNGASETKFARKWTTETFHKTVQSISVSSLGSEALGSAQEFLHW